MNINPFDQNGLLDVNDIIGEEWGWTTASFKLPPEKLIPVEAIESKPMDVDCEELYFAIMKNSLYTIKKQIMNRQFIPYVLNGFTPYQFAIYHGHLDIIKFFEENQLFIPALERSNIPGRTNLLLACAMGRLDVVEHFIKRDNALLARDNQGLNALHIAASCGHLPVVKRLISVKMDTQAVDIFNKTALHNAIINGHLYIAKYFIENKIIDPNLRDGHGLHSLHLAALFKRRDILKYLLSLPNINLLDRTNKGNTVLGIAIQELDIEAILMLLNSGYPIDAICPMTGHTIKQRVLQINKVKIDEQLKKILNILHISEQMLIFASKALQIEDENYEDALSLLKNGVSAKRHSDGKTALHLAIENGNHRLVKDLMEFGANLELKDNDNNSPFDLAEKSTQPSIQLRFNLIRIDKLIEECRITEGQSKQKMEFNLISHDFMFTENKNSKENAKENEMKHEKEQFDFDEGDNVIKQSCKEKLINLINISSKLIDELNKDEQSEMAYKLGRKLIDKNSPAYLPNIAYRLLSKVKKQKHQQGLHNFMDSHLMLQTLVEKREVNLDKEGCPVDSNEAITIASSSMQHRAQIKHNMHQNIFDIKSINEYTGSNINMNITPLGTKENLMIKLTEKLKETNEALRAVKKENKKLEKQLHFTGLKRKASQSQLDNSFGLDETAGISGLDEQDTQSNQKNLIYAKKQKTK